MVSSGTATVTLPTDEQILITRIDPVKSKAPVTPSDAFRTCASATSDVRSASCATSASLT